MAKLAPAQQRFADEYLVDLNATRAYKVAYPAVKSDNAASANAARTLRIDKVKNYISQKQTAREKRTEITQDMVVKELARVAFANGSEFARVVERPVISSETGLPVTDDDGKPLMRQCVVMTPTDKLSPDQRAAIAGIK